MIIKIITIITVIALFYGNTLFNGFVHDDIWQVAENKDIKRLDRIPKIFSSCIAEEILGTCYNKGFYYRPLQSVSYLLTSQISKSPWIFHLFNLAYFFALSVLTFNLFKIFLKGRIYPFLATLFFLAHPINSETVNWVSAVPELLLAILTLAMLMLYIKFSTTLKIKFLIASSFVYFLALLSKETAFFTLGLIVLYELVFKGFKRKNIYLRKYFQAFVFYLPPIFLYFIIRSEVLGRVIYKYEGFYSLSFWQQIINPFVLYTEYILKLIWPLPLSSQQRFFPIATFDWRILVGFLFLALSIYLIRLAFKKSLKVLIFGFFFFLITLLPVLIFINKLGEFVISERYLLLPSIGFTLLVFEGLRMIYARHSGEERSDDSRIPKGDSGRVSLARMTKKVGVLVFIIYLIISWYIVAVNRNKDWKDNLSSYKSIVRADPANKKAFVRLGDIYLEKGNKEAAKLALRNALLIDPSFQEAYSRLFVLSGARFTEFGITFFYPGTWNREDVKNGVILKSSDNLFTLELKVDKKPSYQTVEEYLEREALPLGTLINQGPALIPNVDKAYVKLWIDNNVNKSQFFLFKKDTVVEITVFPSDSSFMREFDEILRSLKIM